MTLIRIIPLREPRKFLTGTIYGALYGFDACRWKRGKIRGTPLIPPNKIKELLPSKKH